MSDVLTNKCNVTFISIFSRFADRDMVMRFFGGAIGHKATNKYTSALRDDVRVMANVMQSSAEIAIYDVQIPDSEEAQQAEEEEYGYEIDNELEDSSEDEDEDLGAEEGEEPWEMDDTHAEGYDDL